jgi:transglutaminase-like putative cysteine protease
MEDSVVSTDWKPEPDECYLDFYGNVCRRLLLQADTSSFEYQATVSIGREPEEMPGESHVQLPAADLPASALHWLLPSRYCESDALAEDARMLFGETAPNGERVQAICDWIHDNVEYGVPSLPITTAEEIFQRRGGMCRDFAHLGVTFCRALNIPARYVCGYIPDIGLSGPQPPQDFHAWFEVLLGGDWWAFDARFNVPRIGRIPIARGRDAADVAMVTTFGTARLEAMTVWANVNR